MPAADASLSPVEPLSQTERGYFPTPRQFFSLLLAYFTLQIILRICISSSLDLDESEQLVLTQKLSWGYGSQPPLYTWIQFGFFKVFGLSVFGLSLLKNILLFCTYVFTYLNARLITRRHVAGVAAAASLLFIPQIAWESQRDLTHSVLAATLACVTLFCFLRLTKQRSLAAYVLFGLCAGLGVLSKYNFALVVVALALAAVSTREFRALTLDKRIVLAAAIAVLIILPNLLWAKNHPDLALRAAGKFKIQESTRWLSAIVAGFKTLAVASVAFFGPLALVYGIIFWKRRDTAAAAPRNPYMALLLRTLFISYGFIVLAIVVLRISDVRDRWLQPILICLPVLAIAWFQDRLDGARLKRILEFAFAAAILVTVALHGRIIWAERMHRTQPWNRPYDALAAQLKGPIAPASTVMTDTTLLAGNLRLNIPDKIFTPPELAGLFEQTDGPIALVWEADTFPPLNESVLKRSRKWPPPANLMDFTDKMGMRLDKSQAQYFDALFKYHKMRRMEVGVVVK